MSGNLIKPVEMEVSFGPGRAGSGPDPGPAHCNGGGVFLPRVMAPKSIIRHYHFVFVIKHYVFLFVLDILYPFCKMTQKLSKKALRFPLKVACVLRLCKTLKTVSKQTFRSFQKLWTKYLIKPVVYWSFGCPFRKGPQKYKKALGFH